MVQNAAKAQEEKGDGAGRRSISIVRVHVIYADSRAWRQDYIASGEMSDQFGARACRSVSMCPFY